MRKLLSAQGDSLDACLTPQNTIQYLPCNTQACTCNSPSCEDFYRPIDGGNQTGHSGASYYEAQGRVRYTDGLGSPAGDARPSARLVSNALFQLSTDSSRLQSPKYTALLPFMGLFLLHDISSPGVPSSYNCRKEGEAFNISVPQGDTMLDRDRTGQEQLAFNRTAYCESSSGKRRHLNLETSFVDLSNVYGADDQTLSKMRSFTNGQVKLAFGVPEVVACTTSMSKRCFDFADPRGNELAGVGALHILFLREHNRMAEYLQKKQPDRSDEVLFQEARKMVSSI